MWSHGFKIQYLGYKYSRQIGSLSAIAYLHKFVLATVVSNRKHSMTFDPHTMYTVYGTPSKNIPGRHGYKLPWWCAIPYQFGSVDLHFHCCTGSFYKVAGSLLKSQKYNFVHCPRSGTLTCCLAREFRPVSIPKSICTACILGLNVVMLVHCGL